MTTRPVLQSAASQPDDEEKAQLVENLLGLRRLGPPPFLVRNLRYVKSQRKVFQNQLWDLRWAAHNNRGGTGIRRLALTCSAQQCLVADASVRQLFCPPRPGNSDPGRMPTDARLRLWLSAVLRDDERLAFGVRETVVKIWASRSEKLDAPVDECPVSHTFDLSAILAFLAKFPARLSIVVELYPLRSDVLEPRVRPVLRGEQCLTDMNISTATSVPNRDFVVDLYCLPKTQIDTTTPQMGLRQGALPKIRAANTSDGNLMRSDGNVNGATEPIDVDAIDVDSSPPRSLDKYAFETSNNLSATGPARGVLTLNLRGALSSVVESTVPSPLYCEDVLVRCSYVSPQYSWWTGIVRHDFICPWCHRNCRRLRTLLTHFHLDHDRIELSLEGVQNTGGNADEAYFTLIFNITPVKSLNGRGAGVAFTKARNSGGANGRRRSNGSVVDVRDNEDEDVIVNRRRYRSYSTPRRKKAVDKELDMTKCAVADVTKNSAENEDEDSDSTQFNDRPGRPRDYLLKEGWGRCLHCNRPHQKLYTSNVSFCGEWCEIVHNDRRNARRKLPRAMRGERLDTLRSNRATQALPPLASLTTATRTPRINFKETLGQRTLYHVVSVTPVRESHFDEDDGDSEDEVDQSWRLRITEEKLHHLENACAVDRALWILWNRYAFENYPAPGAYAERYTRHSLEEFVFEYANEIHRLNLRLPLIGFLRACHVHGCIDGDAVLSVLLCLDGKKKRRQCAASSRPEVLDTPAVARGRSRRIARPSRKKATRKR